MLKKRQYDTLKFLITLKSKLTKYRECQKGILVNVHKNFFFSWAEGLLNVYEYLFAILKSEKSIKVNLNPK